MVVINYDFVCILSSTSLNIKISEEKFITKQWLFFKSEKTDDFTDVYSFFYNFNGKLQSELTK